jgi:hypothetical protein
VLWEGRSKEQICEQMKDPALRERGSRAPARGPGPEDERIRLHVATAAVAHENFVEVLEAWVKAGMPCR